MRNCAPKRGLIPDYKEENDMKFQTGKRKHSLTVNLFEQHIAQALDELLEALRIKDRLSHDDFLIEWRLSISCILHSFYAIDGLINYLAYEYFENIVSDWYINPEDRKIITEQQLTKWNQLPFDKRLEIIWKEKEFDIIPSEMKSRIYELKNLRNWIAHGKPYTIILEHEFVQVDDETVRGIIHATYPDPNRKDFESKEFKSPAYLNKDDARKAVWFALEIIIFILEQAKGFRAEVKTFFGGVKELRLNGKEDVKEVFKNFGIG